jgi:hypothetical protein
VRRVASLVALALAIGTAYAADPLVQIEAQDSGTTVRLRGISAVDGSVAWASGREGTVLRTLDGGKHWTQVSVPDAKDLDFRDIEAFDANSAVVLSIGPGEASRVYRTEDGGNHWTLALKNTDERAFFDCMVFDGVNGWMLGDPVEGRYQIRTTQDGGRTWELEADGPVAKKDEAAFAASGTCIIRGNYQQTIVLTGGADARAFGQRNGFWKAYDVPMPHRIPAAGIFSGASLGGGAVLVGGDFEHDENGSAAWLHFSAHGTYALPLSAPRGYRSGAACFGRQACVAVGPTGVDLIADPIDATSNTRWSAVSDTGYDTIDVGGKVAWASGDKGRIARITLSSSPPPDSPSSPPQATPLSKP